MDSMALDAYRVLAHRIKWLETSKIKILHGEAIVAWEAAKSRAEAAERKLKELKEEFERGLVNEAKPSSFWCCVSHSRHPSSEHHFDSIKAQYYQAMKDSNIAEAAVRREALHRDALAAQSDELRHARMTEDKILTQLFGDAHKAPLVKGSDLSGTFHPNTRPDTPPVHRTSITGTVGPRDIEVTRLHEWIHDMAPDSPSPSLHSIMGQSLWDRQGLSLAQALSNEEMRLSSLQLSADRATLAVNMLASAMSKANLAKIRLSEACEKSAHGTIPGSVGEWLLRQEGSSKGARHKKKISKLQLNNAGVGGGLGLISEAAEDSELEHNEDAYKIEGRSSANVSISSESKVKGSSPASSTRNASKVLLPPLLRLSNTEAKTREVEMTAMSSKSTGLLKVLVQPAKSSMDLKPSMHHHLRNLHCLSFDQAGFQPRSSIYDLRPSSPSNNIFETCPRASKGFQEPPSPTPQTEGGENGHHGENEPPDEEDLLSKLGKGIELPPQSAELAKQGAHDAMAAFLDYSSAQHLVQALEESKADNQSVQPQLLLQLRPSFSKLLEPRRDGKRQAIASMDASLANQYLLAVLELAGHIEVNAKALSSKADTADGKLEACRGAVAAGKSRLRVHQREILLNRAKTIHEA